jgi:isoleucyl-tRNA synthetase
VMRLVSLGHAARQKANRRVRQPLREAAFSVGNVQERAAVERFADLIADELNVKSVRLLDASTEAVSHSLKPLPKQLGQKYGNRFPAIQKAILALDAEQAARALLNGQSLQVEVDGETYEILPQEVEVRAQARSGFEVAEEGPYLAALVTELTPELIAEGLAREFVRYVQDLRKQADLEITDRIVLYVEASEGLRRAIETYRDYIQNETLTVELHFEKPASDLPQRQASFDGQTVLFGIKKR